MRQSDRLPLEVPYQAGAASENAAFADVIGVGLPATRRLAAAVAEDLDDEHGIFGIGWWFPHPGTKRRILISDCLVQSIESIETNVLEARLHLLESRDAVEQENAFMERAVEYDDLGRAQVRVPPRLRPIDDLPRLMRDLHVVGFFRAVGSALDCLAAAIVGTLGLEIPIQRAHLSGVRRHLAAVPVASGTPEAQLWIPVRRALDGLAQDKHPGWLDWALGLRNTLVHRARPIWLQSLHPESTLARPGRDIPFIKTSAVLLLPRDPRRSDVEVLGSEPVPVLTEDADTTMECVLDQTICQHRLNTDPLAPAEN